MSQTPSSLPRPRTPDAPADAASHVLAYVPGSDDVGWDLQTLRDWDMGAVHPGGDDRVVAARDANPQILSDWVASRLGRTVSLVPDTYVVAALRTYDPATGRHSGGPVDQPDTEPLYFVHPDTGL